ncbi:transcription factor bHLH140 isoform X2 [Telopea speciosissima]|uniref:transcription factor bHLH140 isoform X2 n=1 Tax=Telopea speciosissima TaxID=54955 RepID=UPI001CC7A496|nr:transcription factor bHLH140 isoform X2 [Telopea speciosissima]
MEVDCENTSKEEKTGKNIVVILVGAPGSGKSTFCENVMSASRRPWVRICQDTIANGKAGTKAQCLSSATEALKDGKSVFIDRCSLEKEQRVEFVKLGGLQVDVHAVVLDLPAKLCISRLVVRTGHEGNLQGGKAAVVVNRMLQKKELPNLGEGFSRITFCQNESDVQGAVNTYCGLGPLDTLPSGYFGQKNRDAKIQLGIMKFFKKVGATDSATLDKNCSLGSVSEQETKENDPSYKEPEKVISSVGNVDEWKTEDLVLLEGSSVGSNGVPTLAFPSISTSDFQFNQGKASDIIVEKVEEFLSKVGNVRLVLVDLHESKILSLVRSKAVHKNVDSKRFMTSVGDITRLYTRGGLRCNVIANAANWRLKSGGGGVNAAIYSAAGPALEAATKERAGSLCPGKAVVVPLPSTSPLFKEEGVTHVIHVLGPNMNPQRPNCLNNDYDKGCRILGEAYSSLFEGFASILSTQTKLWKGGEEGSGSRASELHDNLSERDTTNKREGRYDSDRNKKYKGLQEESGIRHAISGSKGKEFLSAMTDSMEGKVQPKNENIDSGRRRIWSSWAQALYHIAMHPEKHKNDVLEISDDIVVLNDLYPKAQKHLLMLTRMDGLDSLADVGTEQLQLLKTMHAMGLKWVQSFLCNDASLVFRLGYHSAPSMRQLHLHVISLDFNSNHLKNKKHWNSFNTAFFRDSVDVIEEIEKYGKATLHDDEKLLSMELRCHRCRSAHPNIPRLKSHIRNCRAPFHATLLQNDRLVLAPSRVHNEA